MAFNNEDQLIVAPPGEWGGAFTALLLAVNFTLRISIIRVTGSKFVMARLYGTRKIALGLEQILIFLKIALHRRALPGNY
ncbi:MAG: hypothetical protein ACXVB0_15370 [Mucilaginibacter sp.]